MVGQMVKIGEETGELEKMLSKIADFYEDEVDASIQALTSIIEPIMMIGVGVMVGDDRHRHVPADVQAAEPHRRVRGSSAKPALDSTGRAGRDWRLKSRCAGPPGRAERRGDADTPPRQRSRSSRSGSCPLRLPTSPRRWWMTFSAVEIVPAGDVCDFDYQLAFTARDTVIEFTNGTATVHSKFVITHTNLDTGYALTEKGVVTLRFCGRRHRARQRPRPAPARPGRMELVVVQAGRIVFDPSGEIVRFTPGTDPPGFPDVICPALGGAPA